MPSPNLNRELEKKLLEIEKTRLEDGAKKIAAVNGLHYLPPNSFPVENDALSLLSEQESKAGYLATTYRKDKTLEIVLLDPANSLTKASLQKLTEQGYSLTISVVSLPALEQVWKQYVEVNAVAPPPPGTVRLDSQFLPSDNDTPQDIDRLKDEISSFPTSDLLEVLLSKALRTEASDIHLEPEEKEVRVRYRLDGVLHDIATLEPEHYHQLLSRIKITSKLKLNIHNAPQDGRFTIATGTKDIGVRTSVLPGPNGENIVMRLLDPDSLKQNIEDLGLAPDQIALLNKLLSKTTGALLTTGPTGSGKTTSLYAFLKHINEPGSKIITIEDPIEYHLAGISQTQVDPARGYTFASGLRSIVRQDPDVILVGEIRDGETAEIAMQAALTGHLVFSTLHTNNAAGVIPRLIDLGAKPVSIAPALNAVIAQRLVRKLCLKCKQKKTISPEEIDFIKESYPSLKTPPTPRTEIYYPQQCLACHNTGYRGRLGAFEIFVVDRELEEIILTSPSVSTMRDLAAKKGMVTMLEDGLNKVLAGQTSLEEVRRVLG